MAGVENLATHYEVSARTVQNWIKRGLPTSGSGKARTFDLDQTDPWVEAYRDESATGDDGTSAQINLELKQEKLKVARMEREQFEEQRAIEKGNLLPRDEYERGTIELVQVAKARLMSVPRELASLLPKKQQQKHIAEGEKLVRRILNDFARGAERLRDEGPQD